MTSEQQFFFQVLRDHMNGVPTAVPAGLDWTLLCSLAEKHKLAGIFFSQCGTQITDPSVRMKLMTAFGGAVSHYTNLRADYALLRSALEGQHIRYVPIKGALIADCYPVPELRTMGDIDILVHADDKDRIRSCLEKAGFRNKKWAEDEWHYVRGSSLFEIQGHMMNPTEPGVGEIYRYFNVFWPHVVETGEAEGRLDPSFHFFYLIAHIAKHLRWSGVGFRQFYDLAVLMHRDRSRYDWDWIRAEAERIGFDRFTVNCLAMTERWFGVPSPYGTEALSEPLFDSITENIFRNGVFGFDNRDNRVYELEQAQRRSSQPLLLVRLRSAAKLAFPPYRNLVVSEKYAFLRGRPWLLPYAWARRALRGRSSSKRHDIGAMLTVSEKRLRQRSDQLRELGLEFSEKSK